MYGIIALISAWIRQFYLPNPFVNIIDPLYADLFNIIIGGFIIHILAYYITGCIYEKGSSPGLGSFLYVKFGGKRNKMMIVIVTIARRFLTLI